jgi:hypothetical protein
MAPLKRRQPLTGPAGALKLPGWQVVPSTAFSGC